MPIRGKAKTNTKVELLRDVPLFSACTNKELQKLASLFDEIEAEEGQVLAKEGSPGYEFFVIVEGDAKVSLRKRKLAELGAGAFFGEMSLLDHEPRSATVTAAGPMHLLVLDASNFQRFIRENPDVTVKILKGVAQRLRTVEKAPKY